MRIPYNSIDRSGQKFNSWTIVKYLHTEVLDRHRKIYLCRCDCGYEVERYIKDIVYGRSKSCGCTKNTNTKDLMYKTWYNMKQRCYNPENAKYKNYGARGIIVCDRWLNSFADFVSDVGNKPTPKHSLDRINNNGNYEPSNCRWATPKEQAANKQKPVADYVINRVIVNTPPPNQ